MTRSALLFAAVLAPFPHAARADAPVDPDGYELAPACVDNTDVVGYRRCSPYGEWASNLEDPYVFVDLGVNLRHFAFAGSGVAARTTSPTGTIARPGGDEALMLDERIGFGLSPHLYLALDFELGNFAAFDSSSSFSRDVVLESLGAFGFRAGTAPLSLGVEVAGGAQAVSFASDSDLHTTGVLEVRGRGELWLSPWVTLGAVLGTSVIDSGNWMTGLYLGFHSYAFAGDR